MTHGFMLDSNVVEFIISWYFVSVHPVDDFAGLNKKLRDSILVCKPLTHVNSNTNCSCMRPRCSTAWLLTLDRVNASNDGTKKENQELKEKP